MKDSALKRKLVNIYEQIYATKMDINLKIYYLFFRLVYHIKIMNATKTIEYIKRNKCSVARYGDGEFGLAFGFKETGFQKKSNNLKNDLLGVFCNIPSNLLVCIPKTFNNMRGYKNFAKRFWMTLIKKDNQGKKIVKLLNSLCNNYFFGDSLITRPYMDWKNSNHAKKVFPRLKSIWENEKILIIEGEQTRLGVGNDLFNNATSIKRIICPSIGAYCQKQQIISIVKNKYDGELILLALGPTATVLASDFARDGMWAIDIGHIDIEYEWFLRNATNKVPISGKFVNEVGDNTTTVTDCTDDLYLSEIICKIGC